MTWDPLQEPPRWQGPFTEYGGGYGPATGPQMPPPYYGWPGARPGPEPAFNAPPLSFWEAIKQLPRQYWRVLTKPGPATFAEEMGKARWDVIWAQLLGLSLLSAILTSLALLIIFAFLLPALNSSLSQAGDPNANTATGLLFLPIPLIAASIFVFGIGGFFLGQGIIYLLAKAFGGQGSFRAQAYTAMLYQVPISIVTLVLSLIPFVGSIGSLAGIYAYVLEAFALMPVHRLSGGKATAVVVIPIAAGFVLTFILFFAFFFLLFSTISALPAPQ